MKAKELMIGDWVLMDIYCPPTGLLLPLKVTPQDLLWIMQGKKCEPIPLTYGILEKNEWMNKDNTLCYLDAPTDKGIDAWLEYREHNKTLFIGDGLIPQPINYVHELQHALRLCGLNDLADNFQI